MSNADELLAHHRRDARTALLLQALLLILLILLWILHRRVGLLSFFERSLVPPP